MEFPFPHQNAGGELLHRKLGRRIEMDSKELEKCESELIEQGHSSEEAKRLCAEQEESEEKDQSDFDYPE